MSKYVSPMVNDLPFSGIRRFFDLASTIKGVISLGVGEPDFITPWPIREACLHSLERGYTMYTSNRGLLELRQEIKRYLANNYGLAYDYDREILITVGASEAVDLAMRTVVCPGEEVLVPEPSYVSYKPCVILAGGVPVSVETTSANEFKLSPGDLEEKISPRTKALMLSYPNNPTGAVMTRSELAELAKVVEKHDLVVISDEIYGELTYNGKHFSFPALEGMRDRTILINGFSKAFAMTGWRLGYAAAPSDLAEAMLKIHQYTILCAPVMSQMAALEAVKNCREEVENMTEKYDRRRRLVVSRLREMGLSCFEPQGAFYVFPSIRSTGMTSEQFAQRLLDEEKVAVVPGNVFGAGGEGHVRISYAASVSQISEALNRMGSFIKRSGG